MDLPRSQILLAFIFVFTFLIIHIEGQGKYRQDLNNARYEFESESPFRVNKLNVIWQKAKKASGAIDLRSLHKELVAQDKLELQLKKRLVQNLDETGEEEAQVRKRLRDILEQYGLLEEHRGARRMDNVLGDVHSNEGLPTFEPKLDKLWRQAQDTGFSDDELETLKTEFTHHQMKTDELAFMRRELNDMEDISANSVHRFDIDGRDEYKKNREQVEKMKREERDMRLAYQELEEVVRSRHSPDAPFTNPKVLALLNQAKKANFSETELASFKQELAHFEHKLNKLEFLRQESNDVRKAPGKSNQMPQDPGKMEGSLTDYDRRVKKYYTQLKMKIAEKTLHTEL